MIYRVLIRPLLFLFPPESIHHFTFRFIKIIFAIRFTRQFAAAIYTVKNPALECKVFGIHFPNPVGLAAGFDKDAKLFDELAAFGFGFVEIGTLTPKPQTGNEKPRLFRLPADKGLINRMGFNNEGVDAAVERLKKRKSNIIIGGNIGKNKVTPNEKAGEDYAYCFNALFDYVDYFVVNVSSPNTPGLRELQEKEPLTKILSELQKLNQEKTKPKPILLKIAPDLTNTQLDDIIDIVHETKIAGVIATNTTVSRENLRTEKSKLDSIGTGGLSGIPVGRRSTEVIKYLSKKSGKAFPVIGVGGIHSPQDAQEKLNAGASLVQVYTGFIYEGPGLVKKICRKLI